MRLGDSVDDSDRAAKDARAWKSDAARTIAAAGVKASIPGLRMIAAPMNPTNTAAARRGPTVSPRIRAAPITANSGEVKLSAVAWARGMMVTAVNQHSWAPVAARARRP